MRDRIFRLAMALLIGVGTLIRIQQLFNSLAEAHAFRQTQTAFTVRQFAEHGINLLTAPLPVFGPDASVPMEFPLFQAIASLLVPLGIEDSVAARLVGLISFQATAILLALLLVRWHGRGVAVVATALFQFLPFGLQWGAASLIDFFSVALALLMVVGLDRYFSRKSIPWLFVGSIGAILGFLVKVTTVPSWGLLVIVSLILVIREAGWAASWRRIVIGLIVAPGLGFVAAVAWTAYADSVKAAHEWTVVFTSSSLRSWNFGTLKQRLDPQNYLIIADRVSQEIAGPLLLGLVLSILAVIYRARFQDRVRTLGWLAVALVGPLLFFNLYVVHSYYLIAIYPALVAATAIGIVWLVRLVPGNLRQKHAVGAVAMFTILTATAATPNGQTDISNFIYSRNMPALSAALLAQTLPDDRIIIVGCDWNPTTLFYGERTGIMFRQLDPGSFWDSHDIGGYHYLATCDPALDAPRVLPAGYRLTPTPEPNLYAVSPRP